MSGTSGDQACPRCGKPLETYDDWKPHTTTSGRCPHCGYYWYTGIHVASDSGLKQMRDEYEENTCEEGIKWPDRNKDLDQERIKAYDNQIYPTMDEEISEQAREYIASAGMHCPFCKSSDINAMAPDVTENGTILQEVECDSCGKKWTDTYKLTNMEEINER